MDNKTERLNIRCSKDQKESIERAAEEKGMTVSQYLLCLAALDNYEDEPKIMLKRIGVKEFDEIKSFRLMNARPFVKAFEAITDRGLLQFEICTLGDGSRRSKITFHDYAYEFTRNVNLTTEY